MKNPYKKKPPWLIRNLPRSPKYESTCSIIKDISLNTVCQEAKCPNKFECYSNGTATFLILGSICTRNCLFCNIENGICKPLDNQEPLKVAKTVKKMNLKYAVITSVTRDDLSDGGAGAFAKTIELIKIKTPNTIIEVLIPDFKENYEALKLVLHARPHVLNHNIETVKGLYPKVRPEAEYSRSLRILEYVKKNTKIPCKSGIMLGLGETDKEIKQTFTDLLNVGCDILTVGQYLQPSKKHLAVQKYVHPKKFDEWKNCALNMGFKQVASGPFVRSSYKAKELFNSRLQK